MIEDWFLALDGDDIGRRLELHIVTEDAKGLRDFSHSFECMLDGFMEYIKGNHPIEILLRGGDSLLLRVPDSSLESIIDAITEMAGGAGFSFSGGYGRTMREAYFALKIAKATGKSRIIPFDTPEWQQ